MEQVRLKNGAGESAPLVKVVMISLENLVVSNPIAAYELVEMCKDRTHKPFGNTSTVLKDLALIMDDDGVHDSIRNIVLSAFVGDGLDMHLEYPVNTEA